MLVSFDIHQDIYTLTNSQTVSDSANDEEETRECENYLVSCRITMTIYNQVLVDLNPDIIVECRTIPFFYIGLKNLQMYAKINFTGKLYQMNIKVGEHIVLNKWDD